MKRWRKPHERVHRRCVTHNVKWPPDAVGERALLRFQVYEPTHLGLEDCANVTFARIAVDRGCLRDHAGDDRVRRCMRYKVNVLWVIGGSAAARLIYQFVS